MVYADAERVERIAMLTQLATMQKDADKIPDAVLSFRQIADLNPKEASAVEATVIQTLVEAKDYKGARATADAALKKFNGDKSIPAGARDAARHAGRIRQSYRRTEGAAGFRQGLFYSARHLRSAGEGQTLQRRADDA